MAAGHRRVIPLSHSAAGLAATARLPAPAGLILVCAPGRPLAQIIRGQLRADPANAALQDQAEAALASLERGVLVDAGPLDPALRGLFAPQVQGYLIDAFRHDPAALNADKGDRC